MLDIDSEKLIPLAEAAATIPSSRGRGSTHVATLHRWRQHGIRGVRLEAARIGGTFYTTREALKRFVDAINSPDADTPADTPAARRRARQAEIDRADRELQEAGV